RIVKEWDAATMKERRVLPRLPDDGLSLAVGPGGKIAVGGYDGTITVYDDGKPSTSRLLKEARSAVAVNGMLGAAPATKYRFPKIDDAGGNESPAHGQRIPLPATVLGALERAGTIRFYRFDLAKGQSIGVQVIAGEMKNFDPWLELHDATGTV